MKQCSDYSSIARLQQVNAVLKNSTPRHLSTDLMPGSINPTLLTLGTSFAIVDHPSSGTVTKKILFNLDA